MTVTTTKGIIRMPDEGDTLTMHVAKCEVVEGQFGEQVKFTDTRGDQLFISRASADRQLARQGFADGELVIYGDVDGQTLVFSRDHNPKGKPYWGIQRVVPADDATHRPSLKEAAMAEAERVRKAKNLPPDDGSMGPFIPGLDAPPPTDDDYPYSDEDGMPPVKATAHPKAGVPLKETEYLALAERVLAWQAAMSLKYGAEVTMASVNAMTFSIHGLR